MRKLSLPAIGGICGVLALVLTLVNVAGAGNVDHWSDIATSPFREQINNIGSAGCASGFADGTFRPKDEVTRQQFAYWMNNCGTRFAFAGNTGQVTNTNTDLSLATVRIEPGVQDLPTADSGFTLVQADVQATVSAAEAVACPCTIYLRLRDNTRNVQNPIVLGTIGGVASADQFGSVRANLSTNDYFVAIPGGPLEYEVRVGYSDPDTPDIDFTGNLTALYVPFGADGGQAITVPPA
jgi:hypothetical protein